jgi:hypothetical protein
VLEERSLLLKGLAWGAFVCTLAETAMQTSDLEMKRYIAWKMVSKWSMVN